MASLLLTDCCCCVWCSEEEEEEDGDVQPGAKEEGPGSEAAGEGRSITFSLCCTRVYTTKLQFKTEKYYILNQEITNIEPRNTIV